jgi:hypothetical protein
MHIAFLIVLASLGGATDAQLRACAAKASDSDRLACFDKLVPAPAPTKAARGKWSIERGKSEMDDSLTVVASLDASAPISFWPGKKHVPTLYYRCAERRVELFVVAGASARVEAGNDTASMRLRLDDGEPQLLPAAKGTSDGTFFLPYGPYYLQTWATFRRLRIEFTPYNSSPVVMDFDITGFGEPYQAVLDACK